jgi:hypothetical protein
MKVNEDRTSPSAAEQVVIYAEPQHDRLMTFEDHGQTWVECLTCGRQWSRNAGDQWAEVVTEGDGFCDEAA